jgi:hypothetical protein
VEPQPDPLLLRVAELLEEHVPDRGRLIWSGDRCQVFEKPDGCGGSTVTTVAADGTESVSHVCGVDVEALR